MNTTRKSLLRSGPERGEPGTRIQLSIDDVQLPGILHAGAKAWGLVVIPHAVAGGHEGPRSGYVAQLIRNARLATLVCDLVPAESGGRNTSPAPSPERLANRLLAWLDEARSRPGLARLPIGVVAPGAAAAPAIVATVRRPALVRALVCHGGRPDLAHDALGLLRLPTLFLVGENDTGTLRFNRHALSHLRCPRRLELVEGAHHNFTEPGALAQAAGRMRRWMVRYLPPAPDEATRRASPVLRLMAERAGPDLEVHP